MQAPLTLGQYTNLLKQDIDHLLTSIVSACIITGRLSISSVSRKGIYLDQESYNKLNAITPSAIAYYGTCLGTYMQQLGLDLDNASYKCIDHLATAYLVADCPVDGRKALDTLSQVIAMQFDIDEYAEKQGFEYTTSLVCAAMEKITGTRRNKIDGYDCSRKRHLKLSLEFKEGARKILEQNPPHGKAEDEIQEPAK